MEYSRCLKATKFSQNAPKVITATLRKNCSSKPLARKGCHQFLAWPVKKLIISIVTAPADMRMNDASIADKEVLWSGFSVMMYDTDMQHVERAPRMMPRKRDFSFLPDTLARTTIKIPDMTSAIPSQARGVGLSPRKTTASTTVNTWPPVSSMIKVCGVNSLRAAKNKVSPRAIPKTPLNSSKSKVSVLTRV